MHIKKNVNIILLKLRLCFKNLAFQVVIKDAPSVCIHDLQQNTHSLIHIQDWGWYSQALCRMVVILVGSEGSDCPALLTAITRNWNSLPSGRPSTFPDVCVPGTWKKDIREDFRKKKSLCYSSIILYYLPERWETFNRAMLLFSYKICNFFIFLIFKNRYREHQR